MKLRNNNETLYATPFGITKDLLEVKPNSVDPERQIFTATEMAEMYGQLIAHTKLANVPANVTCFQDAFQYLEVKAEAVRKTLSFWDAYQIREVLTKGEEESLLAKITQLPGNSSIIANTAGSWIKDGSSIQYYPGDIFIKDYYNNINHVPMVSTGYYYPSAITQVEGSTWTITYTYATQTPEDSGTTPTKVISYPISAANESGYNISTSLTSTAVTFQKINNLYPSVKAYLNGEQIFGAVTITSVDTNWSISKVTNVPNLTITVR